MPNNSLHEPVLVKEVLEGLGPLAHLNRKLKIIDATLGTGGHSQVLLDQGYQVLAIDADQEMLSIARSRLKGEVKFAEGNFKDLDKIAGANNFRDPDVILFDLGVSNLQLTSVNRGFSFTEGSAPLDMRMDRKGQQLTAADLLNILRRDQLESLFGKVLKPWEVKRIVAEIIKVREFSKFVSVADFLAVCSVARTKPGLNRATLPFLALRIAVNSELENLEEALPKAYEVVKKGGRIVIIYFHSLERDLVKSFVKKFEQKLRLVNIEPIGADFEEIKRNPRARSARLVILEKL